MKKYYITMKQDLQDNSCEWLEYEGTSYKEALKELSNLEKGYIMRSLINDVEELKTNDDLFTSDDDNCEIIKTKGWGKK